MSRFQEAIHAKALHALRVRVTTVEYIILCEGFAFLGLHLTLQRIHCSGNKGKSTLLFVDFVSSFPLML